MATARLLTELAKQYEQISGDTVAFESVGGVDAARRVSEGEVFDVVVLADNAVAQLLRTGMARAGTKTAFARSQVAVAMKTGSGARPIGNADELRAAVLAAKTVGYSTGPSGVAIARLLADWNLVELLGDRLIQARPGFPVGQLIADNVVELGFQQLSELIHIDGIDIIGPMPPDIPIETIFSAAVCTTSEHPNAAESLLQFLASAQADDAKQRNGMGAV